MSRVGIDARLFGPKHGGIGRYTAELVKNLELQADQADQYFIFLAPDAWEQYQPKKPNFTKVSADFKVYGVFEQLLYPILLYRYKLDLVHFTHFNAPLLYGRKFIVTIHDLIISHYPTSRATTLSPWLYQVKLKAYEILIKAVARRAKKIIAVSQFTKRDIVRLLNVTSAKVAVIYEGVDLPKPELTVDAKLLASFKLKAEYLLYIGSAYPHKNLEKLIKAFELIVEKNPTVQLALVGRDNFFYQRLRKFAEENVSPATCERIIFTGYQSDEHIATLYKHAKLYVFPSLLEGFGLPPLEAQSFGLAVASSDSSCLPEILADSAIYFDPKDISDMSAKISLALAGSGLRADLIKKGRDNIKKYSWVKMAEETLKAYDL